MALINARLNKPYEFVAGVLQRLYLNGEIRIDFRSGELSDSIRHAIFLEVARKEIESEIFALHGYDAKEKLRLKDLPEVTQVLRYFRDYLRFEVGEVQVIAANDIFLNGWHPSAVYLSRFLNSGPRQIKYNRELMIIESDGSQVSKRIQVIVDIRNMQVVYEKILDEMFGHPDVLVINSKILKSDPVYLRSVVAHELGHFYYSARWPGRFDEASLDKYERLARERMPGRGDPSDEYSLHCYKVKNTFERLPERHALHLQMQSGIVNGELSSAEEFMKMYGMTIEGTPETVKQFFQSAYTMAKEKSADDILCAINP